MEVEDGDLELLEIDRSRRPDFGKMLLQLALVTIAEDGISANLFGAGSDQHPQPARRAGDLAQPAVLAPRTRWRTSRKRYAPDPQTCGQSIRIGDDMEIHIAEVSPSRVTIGISAPREVPVIAVRAGPDARPEPRRGALVDAGGLDEDSPEDCVLPAEPRILERAVACYRSGRLEDAEQLYGQVLRDDPQNADALHLLGLLYLESRTGASRGGAGGPGDSAAAARAAVLQHPRQRAARGPRLEPAILSFRKAISLRPNSPRPWRTSDPPWRNRGRRRRRWPAIDGRSRCCPDCAEIHGNLGNALRSAGSPEEAREAYETALRLKPEYAEAWMNLGNLDFDRDEFAEAEQALPGGGAAQPAADRRDKQPRVGADPDGRLREAEEWCAQGVRGRAQRSGGAMQCGVRAHGTGRREIAERVVPAGAREPSRRCAEAHTNLGLALGPTASDGGGGERIVACPCSCGRTGRPLMPIWRVS